MKDYFIHHSSFVDDYVTIGPGTKVWHFCHIMKNAVIGANCTLGQNIFIGADVKIGNNCKVQNNVSIYSGVELEDNVFCGPSVVFTNIKTPRAFIDRKGSFEKTLIKEGASLGANCTIICGNTVGSYALIAAGSVVTNDIPDFALVSGIPAKQIGWVCSCGEVIKSSPLICQRCKKKYTDDFGILKEIN